MAFCCLNNNLVATNACQSDSAPGIQRFYIFNKRNVISYATSTCGYVNEMVLCEYSCGYIFELETQTSKITQTDTLQGQSNPTTLTIEGTYKILNCTDQSTIESLYGGEFTIIALDTAGNWRIAGHIPNLPGFKFTGLTFDSGAASADTIVSTISFILNGSAKRGGWKLFLAGSDSDDMDIRIAESIDYINNLLCDPASSSNCSCTGE